jgi:hypothetical protein
MTCCAVSCSTMLCFSCNPALEVLLWLVLHMSCVVPTIAVSQPRAVSPMMAMVAMMVMHDDDEMALKLNP